MEAVVSALVLVLEIYAGIGVLFALPFVLFWVAKLDPSAGKGTWGFRLLILPGVAALWPLLLFRLMRGTGLPEEHNAHRDYVGGK